jgi:hypothetical protein
VALLVLASGVLGIAVFGVSRRAPAAEMWDTSMLLLPKGESERGYARLLLWWVALGLCFVAIYACFW